MNVSRRNVIAIAPGLLMLSAGCGGWGNYADIAVSNNDSKPYEITIEASGDFQPRDRSSTVSAEERAVFQQMVPKLDYDHVFEVQMSLNGDVSCNDTYIKWSEEKTLEFEITQNGAIGTEEKTAEELGYEIV